MSLKQKISENDQTEPSEIIKVLEIEDNEENLRPKMYMLLFYAFTIGLGVF